MANRASTGETDGRKRPKRDRSLYGLEYHGVAGSSEDCQQAVMRLLQFGTPLARARIISSGNTHCLLLTNAIGGHVAVKSGFTSGYGGRGPTCFSVTLQFLHSHGVEIDELVADASLLDRLDHSALTIADVENITTAHAVRPGRWFEYILDRHEEQGRNGTLWQEFPPVVPFSIIDHRIMDLARNFWEDPDSNLLRGYRRLEDLVRERTDLNESSTKLFSRVFIGKDAVLTWTVADESERIGRANLFVGTFMAYRNPRAHQENPKTELLAEFLLLNHLYQLEREAVNAEPRATASQPSKAEAK
jgi:uncharacterized protein Ymh